MASDTILTIVREVASLVGVGRPTTATGSTDVQVNQLLALANKEGQELTARHDWEELTYETTYATLANQNQGLLNGTIVAATLGFHHILNDTIWNRTTTVGPGGPMTPVSWQAAKATSYSGPYSQYRVRGGYLLLTPAPVAGNTLAFEWVGENWVSNAAGDQTRKAFTADDDYPLLDSRLIKLGLTWRWKAAKGLEYAQDFNDYEAAVLDAINKDMTHAAVSLNGADTAFQPFINVARGNWPL